MKTYIVLYRDATLRFTDAPYGFRCEADNGDHAKEQLQNAEPGAECVWIGQTDSLPEALDDYWNAGL